MAMDGRNRVAYGSYDEQRTAKGLPQFGGERAYVSMPGWSLKGSWSNVKSRSISVLALRVLNRDLGQAIPQHVLGIHTIHSVTPFVVTAAFRLQPNLDAVRPTY